jgi:kynurenine formamidase
MIEPGRWTAPRVVRFLCAAFCIASSSAAAENNPVDEHWWPSEFGADDERGAVSEITAEKRLAAAKLVRKGRTLTLGMPYQQGMPKMPTRTFTLSIPGAGQPLHGPMPWQGEAFQLTFNDELVTAEIGQVGTQFDGLGHVMIRVAGQTGWRDGNYMYNGRRLEDYANGRGLQVNGVEQVAEVGFFTRGILIDVPALLGVERLEAGQEVTVDQFQAALRQQGIDDAGRGDVVLLRTGWIQLWKDNLDDHARIAAPADEVAADNDVFGAAEPGVSAQLCDYLAERGISMLGADQGAIEPVATDFGPQSAPFGYCHVNLLARRGIYLFENLDLEGIASERAYEFLFTWAPLKLVGATGSPGNPIVAW